MPFVPVANTVEVEIRMELDNQQVENTLYFSSGSPPEPGSMTTLGNDVLDWWVDNIKPLCTNALTLREIVVTDLTTNIGPQVTVPAVPFTTGSLIGDYLPANVSLAISFRTNNRGRSFRGRNYVVGLNESQVTGNEVQPVPVGAYQDAYGLLLNAPFQPTWQWSVVSRYSGVNPTTGAPIPRTEGVSTPITAVTVVDPVVDSQRRRLPGRGK